MARSGRPATTDPQQWVDAALLTIEQSGVGALSVEAVARRLGVTKGGFYWHFDGRRDLLRAALDTWEQRHVVALAERFDAIADPRERLRRLLRYAAVEIEPTVIIALLAAADDPDVAASLQRATDLRLALLQRIFEQLGLTPAPAKLRAMMAYSAYIGLAQLRAQQPQLLGTPRKVAAYLRDLEAVLLHDVS